MKHSTCLLLIALLAVLFCACSAEPAVSDSPLPSPLPAESEISEIEPAPTLWRAVKLTGHFPYPYSEVYSYNEDGLLSEIFSENAATGKEETTVFSYDAAGNLLSKITYDQSGKEVAFLKYTYNDGLTETKAELENGSFAETLTRYFYDGEGVLHKTVSTTGNVVLTEFYTYDANGHTVETFRDTAEKASYVTRYGIAGNLIERTDSDGFLQEKNTYDDQFHLLKSVEYFRGEQISEYRFEYDDSGNLLRRELYSYGELLHTLVYAYDSHGNNIKQSMVAGNNTQVLTETEYQEYIPAE